MEYLQNLLDSTQLPFLSAFILGIMTAISPCPLALNITAVAYISKDIENKKRIFINGLVFTLGKALSYTIVGVILFLGASKFKVARLFQLNGEKLIGPLLLFIGIGIIVFNFVNINLPAFGKLSEKLENGMKKGSWVNALLLGILFALAFCPYSGFLYFGILIPMTIASTSGLYLPLVFGIATGLPVIFIAYLLAFTISGIGTFYNKLKIFEKWFRMIVAATFIAVGIYYILIFYFKVSI